MKISGKAIDGFIKAVPETIAAILVYGHDRGMIADRARTIAQNAVPDINDPFAVSRLDAAAIAADAALLYDHAAAMPATGGKRLVLVDNADAGILAAARNLLDAPPPMSLTLITADDSVNTRSALVKLFDASDAAAGLGCYHDTGASLKGVIEQTLREANVRIDRDALEWATSHLGADRMMSRMEAGKLATLAGDGGHLDLASVRMALGDGAQIAAGDVVNAAAAGDIPRLGRALDRAMMEGIEGERIIRSAINHFRRLFRITAGRAGGMSLDEAFRSVRPPVFFSEKSLMEDQAGKWSPTACRRAIDRLCEAELQSRTGVDSFMAAGQALLSLAVAKSRAR